MTDDRWLTPGRRRWLRRAAWGIGSLAVLFVLFVFVLPSPLARWLITRQLEALGVTHEGVETVKVDLWNSRVGAGPILMRGDAREPARLGSVEVAYSLANLFERRAFVETFTLSGVDVVVRRARDGTWSVNGVTPPPPEPAAVDEADGQPAVDAEGGSGFGYGVSTFVFTDSALVLEDYTGGRLTLTLDRLELADFRSWEPESSGRYDLAARLNDAPIRATGEASPFAETIRIVGDVQVDGVTLDAVAAFAGPTGLVRQNGSQAIDIRHDISLGADGTVAIALDGTAATTGIDLQTARGEVLTADEIGQTFASRVAIAPDGRIDLSGGLDITLHAAALAGADGARIGFDEASLSLADMDLVKGAELREGASAMEEAATVAEGGDVGTLIEVALGVLGRLAQETLRHHIDGQVGVAVAVTGFDSVDRIGGTVALARGEVASPAVRLGSTGPVWRLATPITATLAQLTTNAGEARASLDHAALEVASLVGETDLESRSWTLDMVLSLERLLAERSDGGARIDRATIRSERIAVSGPFLSAATLEADLATTLEGVEASAGAAAARAQSVGLALSALTFDDAAAALRFDGRIDVEAVSAEADGAALAMSGAAIEAPGVDVALAPSLTVTGDGFGARIGRLEASGGSSSLQLESGDLALDRLRFDGDALAADFGGRIAVAGVEARAGEAAARAGSVSLDLGRVSAAIAPAFALSGAGVATGSAVGVEAGGGLSLSLGGLTAQADAFRVGADGASLAGGAALSAVKLAVDGAQSVAAAFGAVRASGVDVAAPAGGAPAVAMETVEVDGLDAEIGLAVFATEGAGGAGPGAGAGDGGSSPAIRLGRLVLAPGGRIVLRDSSAGEALRIPVVVDRLEAGPFDTAAPGVPAMLDVDLGIADAARATLSGSVTPLAATPDFDLEGALSGFPLPLVSPYVTRLSGLTVESGTLDVTAAGRAAGGVLAGKVDLRLGEFYVGEPDEETAARFKETYGVPVGFAVGVLKDGDGVIALSLPVAGTVAAPEIDYSDVISKAIGGALASLFPGGAFEGEAGFAIEPIQFDAGAEAPSEAGAEALAAILSVLKAKPDLRLRVCGKAARADLLAMRGADLDGPAPAEVSEDEAQTLLALAQARGSTVRDALVAGGVAAERIGDCRTSYSIESDAPPRVEIQL